MAIPFFDLKQQYHSIKSEVDAAILGVLENTSFVLGPAVQKFETDFAKYCEVKHCVGVSSGTSALQLALLASGVKDGDEVITVGATFVATVASVTYINAIPVLIDVDEERRTLDPSLIEAAITNKTKAILPVHLYGMPADMEPIVDIATRHGLVVIEDAAQAHGAKYHGKAIGSIGLCGCFSFYPGKNLGAYGEGGAVTTNDDEVARTLRMLRDWGAEKKYHHELRGFNMRLEGIQGAVLGVKLPHLDAWNGRRNEIAAKYNDALAGHQYIKAPGTFDDTRSVYHIYGVEVENRLNFMEYLTDRRIGNSIHYPYPVHMLEAYSDLGYSRGDLPVSEKIFASIVSLPMFPEMTDSMVDEVITVLQGYKGDV